MLPKRLPAKSADDGGHRDAGMRSSSHAVMASARPGGDPSCPFSRES